jgi:hypothetical protein
VWLIEAAGELHTTSSMIDPGYLFTKQVMSRDRRPLVDAHSFPDFGLPTIGHPPQLYRISFVKLSPLTFDDVQPLSIML